MMSDNVDHVDSDKEFNERVSGSTDKIEKYLYQLQQQMVEMETRFLKLEAKMGAFDVRFADRCEHIEKVISLYKESISVFDRQIERAESMKFKLVALDDGRNSCTLGGSDDE